MTDDRTRACISASHPTMLRHEIDDAGAWDARSVTRLKIRDSLNRQCVEEISDIAGQIDKVPDAEFRVDHFRADSFREKVEFVRKYKLDTGPGFVVLDGLPEVFSYREARATILCMSQLLGTMISQNQQGTLVKEVKFRQDVKEEERRYSDKREGGDYHTDGAEIPPPLPKYLPLLCIRPAKEGGEFVLLSLFTVHNRLLSENPGALERLYQDFYWDERDGLHTFKKPVFTYNGRHLTCTYLRTYIDRGYLIANKEMTRDDRNALDALDKVIYDRTIAFQLRMRAGQILISNNFTTIHGRTTYEDHDDPGLGRLLLRTWVCEKAAGRMIS